VKLTRDSDLDALEEGGMIDEETVPEWIKSKYDWNCYSYMKYINM